jgi:hypothetical protein
MTKPTVPLKTKRTLLAFAAAALIMSSSNAALGQAGRKLPQTKPAPPKSEPTPTPEPPKPGKPQFTLKVIRDIPQTLYMAFPFHERMETWTVDRLKKSSLLEVTAGDQTNPAEAVRMARAETEAYVIWLQMEEDPMAKPDPAGRHQPAGQVRINFSILEPVTGKTKYSSVIFLAQSIRGVGVLNTSVCYPGVRGDDYLLLQASQEAAARIMDYLKVPVPPACP